jgi:hypothetical protein
MRVTFPRLPDHERAYALVERDDGAVYRLYDGPAGRPLPHDIRHLVVERELHIPDGIWAGIAAGLVLDSMQHISGRPPPHPRRRSAKLQATPRPRALRAEPPANFSPQGLRAEALASFGPRALRAGALASFGPRALRAEALASFVEGVAGLDHPSAAQILTLAATRLSVLPDAEVDPSAVAAAAQALQVEAARWARLRVGEELSYEWPRTRLAALSRARARKPRLVRPIKRRRG